MSIIYVFQKLIILIMFNSFSVNSLIAWAFFYFIRMKNKNVEERNYFE